VAFQNIIFKAYRYLNLVHKNGQHYEITPILMVFVTVYIHFRTWTRIRIRNPRVTESDPAKVPDPSGSGSTTLVNIVHSCSVLRTATVLLGTAELSCEQDCFPATCDLNEHNVSYFRWPAGVYFIFICIAKLKTMLLISVL
jgi:hypothetical protein